MGKRPADPHAVEAKRLQVELTEACKQKAVDRVLQVFHEWETAQATLPKGSFAQALSVLAEYDGGDASHEAHYREARQIFARACMDIRDWAGVGESVFTLMVRLAARAAGPGEAMEYLRQMQRPPVSIRPKLRTFVPILEACARGGLSDEAEALYRNELLSSCTPTEDTAMWTTDMEDRLWQSIFALRLRALARSAVAREDALLRVQAILEDLRTVCPQLRQDSGLPEALREVAVAIGWNAETVQIGMDGVCPATGAVLKPTACTAEELLLLEGLVERLATEQAPPKVLEKWADFKAWLAGAGAAWDVVVDCANVAHHNQNWAQGAFSHAQIGAVLEQCSLAGRQRIALVIRERWLRPETDFSVPVTKKKRKKLPQLSPLPMQEYSGVASQRLEPLEAGAPSVKPTTEAPASAASPASPPAPGAPSPMEANDASQEQLTEPQRTVVELAEEWRRRGNLVLSPPSIDDDWVALYIATVMCRLGVADVQLVTNDAFRDHFFRMRQPPAFRTFTERHLTRYHVLSERIEPPDPDGDGEVKIQSVQLFPPAPYTHNVQRSGPSTWHFPVRLPERTVVGPNGQEVSVDVGEPLWEWIVAWDPGATKAPG